MKLCMVLRLYPPLVGGPATVASCLSKEFSKRDLEVFVVAEHARGLPYQERVGNIRVFRAPFLTPPRVSTHNSARLATGVISLASLTFWVMRKYDIGLVEIFDVSVAGLAGLLLSSVSKRRFLLKYGGDLVFEYLSLKGIRECSENWNVEESWKVDDFRAKLLYWIEKQYVKKYDLLLPDSYYGAELLRKIGADEKKIRVVPNGVDTQDFFPQEPDLEVLRRSGLRRPVILTAARLVPWKGINYLVRAAPAVLRSFPEATFLVVGEGPEKVDLMRQVRDMGLKGNFAFPGRIPHEEMPKVISCADVFVLPSLFDTTPNILLEAMSSGKPVVTSDIEGIREVVKNGKTGILVPPADEKRLSQALLEILSDPLKASEIGRKARELMEQSYSWEAIAETKMQIYHQVLENI